MVKTKDLLRIREYINDESWVSYGVFKDTQTETLRFWRLLLSVFNIQYFKMSVWIFRVGGAPLNIP